MKELIVKENKFPIRADGLEICYDTQYKIVGEIVRCKDCIHRPYEDEEWGCVYPPDVDYICPHVCLDCYESSVPGDDEFCSRGERREDGQTD